MSECHLKEKRVLVFLKHERLSSSDRLEETNHPNLVNYEQILTVTEHRAALTSACESDLHSPWSTKCLTVEIKASHAGTVSTWMETGLVRSPDARNKSSPCPVLLVLEAFSSQFVQQKTLKASVRGEK